MSRLFGTSGVRRRVDELGDDFVLGLAKAVGSTCEANAVLGRDTRESGKKLSEIFCKGLVSTGTGVVDAGIAPTPTVCVGAKDYGLGVVVTASHNPPDYNGFKLFSSHGAYDTEKEQEVEAVFESKNFRAGTADATEKDFSKKHIDLIVDCVGEAEGVGVLLDCAGGAASTVTPKLLDVMGCDSLIVNDNRDGAFPHPLEPTAENLKEVCRRVKHSDVDVAFAHDGDADRTCAISGDGEMIEWDTFLTVLASQSDKVVTTVDASMRIEEYCRKVYRVPVGDVAVAQGIREHDAGFGGEPSGTYIFPDIHMFPDGVATVAKAAKLVAEGRFYELVEDIPTYPMQRVKISCNQKDKEKIINNLKKTLNNLEFSDVDGVRVEDDEGWVLIRPSGTEDYVRVTAEAKTQNKLDELVKQGKQWVKKSLKH